MGLVQDLLAVSSRRRDDDLIRDNRESAFGSGCALEHGLDHFIELVDVLAFGRIVCLALYLVALKRLGAVGGKGYPAAVGLEVCKRGLKEHIADVEVALPVDLLEGDSHDIRLSICTGCEIPHGFAAKDFESMLERAADIQLELPCVWNGSSKRWCCCKPCSPLAASQVTQQNMIGSRRSISSEPTQRR